MSKYDGMLHAYRQARRTSLVYLEEHRRFAIGLVRGFMDFATVPRDRYRVFSHDDLDGFKADRWFHQPFVISFPDYDPPGAGGTDLSVVWRLAHEEDGGWLVKTYDEGESYAIRTEEDRRAFFEGFAEELQSWLSTTLEDAIETEGLNEHELTIGFRIPENP
jgi:hypothetical protein